MEKKIGWFSTIHIQLNTLPCPRDCPDLDKVMAIFKRLTPTAIPFRPTKVWSVQTRRKKPCKWYVLYEYMHSDFATRTLDDGVDEPKMLRKTLIQLRPPNASLVDHEYHDQGWVMVWSIECPHTPKPREKKGTDLVVFAPPMMSFNATA